MEKYGQHSQRPQSRATSRGEGGPFWILFQVSYRYETCAEGICERAAKQDIWTQKGGGERRMEAFT